MGIEHVGNPRVIHHGQGASAHALDGMAGDALTLRAIGPGMYEWQTEEKAALDLELRALLVSTRALEEKSPVVRYRVELGHGGVTYDYPPIRARSGLAEYVRPILPARGLLLRVSARQLRIYFSGGYDLIGGEIAENIVKVSVQPSVQSRRLTLPYQQLIGDSADATAFPMEANEWRVRDDSGVAYFAGAAMATLFGVLDEPLLAAADVAAFGFGDWTPITPLAASVQIAGPSFSMLEFR